MRLRRLFNTVWRRSHDSIRQDDRLQRDPWFHSHYVYAADVIASRLGNYCTLAGRAVLDFGCGDGITALGVTARNGSAVTGVDLTDAHRFLAVKASEILSLPKLPDALRFVKVDPDKPLPFSDNNFDAAYSWSVFEHVDNVEVALAEVFRVLKPGTPFFLQIEPLYASPFGSHLKRLVDEPWAHLLTPESVYLDRVRSAQDSVPEEEKDIMYRTNEFENVKNYLISEYQTLNKITVRELLASALRVGFQVREMQTHQVREIHPPRDLVEHYSEYDLCTNEVQMVLSK